MTSPSSIQILTSLFIISVTIEKTESFNTCQRPGRFPHENPTMYHECHLVGENKFTMFLQSCPQDACFDSIASVCSIDACERRREGVSPPQHFHCVEAGKFPHLDSSRKDAFYKCIQIQGNFFVYEYQCLPAKPCFSAVRQMCQPC